MIGGDGVHSIVRKYVLDRFPDVVETIFSKQYFYVTMAPVETAKEKMGEWFPALPIQYAWCGDRGFIMHDPANSGQTLQLLAAFTTEETWEKDRWTKDKTEAQMREDLRPFQELGKACADVSWSQKSATWAPRC